MVLTTGWPVRLIPARAGKTRWAATRRPRRPAHPRMGGENGDRESEQCQTWGSSPHGRGKLDQGVFQIW